MISSEHLHAATGIHWEFEVGLPRLQESPGQHPRHYAPKTPFFLLEPGEHQPAGRGRVLDMPDSAKEFAGRLYAALYEADSEGWDWIAIVQPPVTPEWDGIRDRLRRASVLESR
jgi:L-threonylcarbamoyladenylate synthase